ncbi:hypothetical protein HGA13_19465 [Nocardia speluncae]|uniref:Uncharacterized protein n=1 Tax=Nocardia speluncae TaxID=419477 RepID=A0A846XFR5_9NOCA|nr:hypothetical protein [Nocardia speluncae]NKY35231.1 hypothetical protein [Nocardia speluncae]
MENHDNALDQLNALKQELVARMSEASPGVLPQFAKAIADLTEQIAGIQWTARQSLTPLAVVQLRKLTDPGTDPGVRKMNKQQLVKSGVLDQMSADLLEYVPARDSA